MSTLDPRVRKLLADIHTSAMRIMNRLQKETQEGYPWLHEYALLKA